MANEAEKNEAEDMRLMKYLMAVAIIETLSPERIEKLTSIWRYSAFEELNQIQCTPEQMEKIGMSMEALRAHASDAIDNTINRVGKFLDAVRKLKIDLDEEEGHV